MTGKEMIESLDELQCLCEEINWNKVPDDFQEPLEKNLKDLTMTLLAINGYLAWEGK